MTRPSPPTSLHLGKRSVELLLWSQLTRVRSALALFKSAVTLLPNQCRDTVAKPVAVWISGWTVALRVALKVSSGGRSMGSCALVKLKLLEVARAKSKWHACAFHCMYASESG